MKLFLKELPLRGLTVPLLLVLGPLLAEISLLLCNSASSLFSRAGQAPRTGRRLAALLVGKVVLVDLDRRPSFLVTKTVLMATTSLPGWPASGGLHFAASSTPTRSDADAQTPNPLTALIMILVPCRNSSLEFILVSGFKCEIRTPSSAFLLCGFRNVPFKLISKCSNGVTSILP